MNCQKILLIIKVFSYSGAHTQFHKMKLSTSKWNMLSIAKGLFSMISILAWNFGAEHLEFDPIVFLPTKHALASKVVLLA